MKTKLPTGIYRRAGTGLLWCSYATPGGRVQESTETSDVRAAVAFRARRIRGARDGIVPSAGITLASWVGVWTKRRHRAGVRTAVTEEQRLDDYVLPVLGPRALSTVSRSDVAELVRGLVAEGRLAPRTVRHVYETLRTCFIDAVHDGVIAATPCTLTTRRGELPEKLDKDPTWRAMAKFSREEVSALVFDARVPLQRRVVYGLLFLGGLRIGEMAGLTWGAYDATMKPLGQLVIAVQYEGRPTKTRRPRLVPVHPVLAEALATWRARDYPLLCRRTPRSHDFIVPSMRDRESHLTKSGVWAALQKDLDALGLRRRRVHDTKRTLVTLAREDGANPDALRAITHSARGDVFDSYTSWSWDALCDAMSALEIAPPPRPAKVVDLAQRRDSRRDSGPAEALNHGARTGSRTPAPRGNVSGNERAQAETRPGRVRGSRRDRVDETQRVTPVTAKGEDRA